MSYAYRQEDNLLYGLERRLGQSIAIYDPSTSSANYQTGKQVTTYTTTLIKKAIVVTSKEIVKFVYDLSFIAANRNFTYGGYFDATSKGFVINKKYLTAPLKSDQMILFNEKTYKVVEILENEKAVFAVCHSVDVADILDDNVRTMLTAGWVGGLNTLLALDILARAIRSLYNNVVPSNLLVWPCCGLDFNSSLMCLFHPDGAGTSVTNDGFTYADYKQLGKNAGILGDSTSYFNIGWNPNEKITLEDFHVSIVYSGTVNFGTNNFNFIDDTFTALNTTVDASEGEVIIVGDTTLRSYVNGTLTDTDATTRSGTLENQDLYIHGNNNAGTENNLSDGYIKSFTAGGKLTVGQVILLNTALSNFHGALGR